MQVKFDPILGLVRERDIADATHEIYVKAYWYEPIASGTNGTLTPPTDGVLAFDQWPDGVDALASEAGTNGKPNWNTPTQTDGTPVTATLDPGGAWQLSAVPAEYPLCIVFCYRIKIKDFNDAYSLDEMEPDTPGRTSACRTVTLSPADCTNKYVTLAHTPNPDSVELDVAGAPDQILNVDYAVDPETRRVTWNELGLDGLLAAGDIVTVTYTY